MYLHLGQDKVVSMDEIVGIFDLDTSTVSKATRDYLAKAEKDGCVTNVCTDLPKSYSLHRQRRKNTRLYFTDIVVNAAQTHGVC